MYDTSNTYSEFTSIIHHDTYPEIDPVTKSDLTGRTVFITGASKGIGRSTAIAYAKAGASQIALGARSSFGTLEDEIRDAAKEAGKPEPKILSLKLDVLDWSTVEAAEKAIEKEFGRLDILLNNAGYLETFIPIADSDIDDYWKTWEVNYRGVYWVTKALLPLIIKTDGGLKTVVNVSSIGGHHISAGASAYQTTKYAIMRFTEFLMVEYEKDGILAYSVHPGGVPTELALNMPKQTHSRILVDQVGIAADTLVFLTQKRRDWLAGRFLSCTWDMPELLSREEEIVKGDKLKMRMVM